MSEHALSAIIVAATILRGKIPQFESLEERCRAAFRLALAPDNGATFMCSSDDEVFRAAVAAVLMADCPDDDKARIERTLRALQAIGAAQRGVPVDFPKLFGALTDKETVPLLGWWHEEKSKC